MAQRNHISRMTAVALVAACAAACASAGGCSQAQPIVGGTRHCANDWKDQIEPLFAARCAPCHVGATPAGKYDTMSYLGVLGNGTHTSPDAVAGSAASILLQTLDPSVADAAHRDLSDLFPAVKSWVLDCNLAYSSFPVHAGGILNPADKADFHGELVKSLNYDLTTCRKCHADDYSGGKSGVSCLTCHKDPGGPTACTTCHGEPPTTGGHVAHVKGGPLGKTFDCVTCHVKPLLYTDVGHIFAADKSVITAPATVVFDPAGPAATTPTPDGGITDVVRGGAPAWDHAAGTCQNVYCHGDVFVDKNATGTKPNWTGTDQAKCGTCHGLAPSNHGSKTCVNCHSLVVDGQMKVVNASLHIDGKVELGSGSGDCSACHGSLVNAAPPNDLSGKTDTSLVSVGAHQSHVMGTHKLRGPIPCSDCHVVPQKIGDPGHIDSELPAEVFPADKQGAQFQSLATADSAAATWNHGTATCQNVYCHGGGKALALDLSPSNTNRMPVWTSVGVGQAECGSCHGVPPKDGNHTPLMGLGTCGNAGCHASSIDGTGAFLVSGPAGAQVSKHINGTVDR